MNISTPLFNATYIDGMISIPAITATPISTSATEAPIVGRFSFLLKYEPYTNIVPTPKDIEKKACPIALINKSGSSTREKSGTKYALHPSPAPGCILTYTISASMRMTKVGINLTDHFSIPALTPPTTINAVNIMNKAQKITLRVTEEVRSQSLADCSPTSLTAESAK